MYKRRIKSYLYIMPAFVFIIVFSIFPLFYSLSLSFYSYRIPGSLQFVGLKNYFSSLGDRDFWLSLRRTFIFIGGVVSIELAIGFILALLMNKQFKGNKIIVALLVSPMMIAPIAIGLIWRMLYNPEYGVINYLLTTLGIISEPLLWLADPVLAFISIMTVDIWQWSPMVFLILLSALRSLPNEPFEAAKIDGASKWQIFVYLTIPLMREAILITVLIRVIDGFKFFDPIFALTRGGPGSSTELLTWSIYLKGLKFLNIGEGCAMSYLLLIIITITSVGVIKLLTLHKTR